MGRIRDGEIGIGERLPPVREVADRFDVSLSTAHQAMRFLRECGVVEAKVGSGYRVVRRDAVSEPPAAAACRGELVTFSIQTWEQMNTTFYEGRGGEILRELARSMPAVGYRVRVVTFRPDEDQPAFIRDHVAAHPPAGVFLQHLGSFEETRRALGYLQAAGIPTVMLSEGYRTEAVGVASVDMDHLGAGAMAMECLLERAPAAVGVVANITHKPSEQLLVCRGAEAAFVNADRAPGEIAVHTGSPDCMQVSGYRATRDLLEANPSIDAWIYAHELLGEGGVEYLREVGRTPGEDAHVVAMPARKSVLDRSPTGIRWIHFPYDRVGEAAGRRLLDAICRRGACARVRVAAEWVKPRETPADDNVEPEREREATPSYESVD